MFMHRIKLENILSFGPDAEALEMLPLNVLIGPNGSGKSNFIEAIGLLRAAPSDIAVPIREGGGAENWIWRGEPAMASGRVEVVVGHPFVEHGDRPLRYSLAFGPSLFGEVDIVEEIGAVARSGEEEGGTDHYLERLHGKVVLAYRDETGKRGRRELPAADISPDRSILSQFKDPFQYRELTSLGHGLERIHFYREWSFGRHTPPRLPQKADLPNGSLAEDSRNLGLVLNRIEGDSTAKKKLLAALRTLYRGIDDYYVQIQAGSVQVFLKEDNLPIPATRLSDGTLRYLCLLAVLCDPVMPSLICIEEPELGLHPDVLPGLADLLRDASSRCQIVVTTHSDTLVDALTETPESIVVCEKENGRTNLRRLDGDDLAHWLEKYRLGELWTSGEIGGTRW